MGNLNNNSNNSVALVASLENHGEIHYVRSNEIVPIEMGLMALIAVIAAKKLWTKSFPVRMATQETENANRPRTFSCARFYARLEKTDKFEGQYDQWVIPEPKPRKSAKDMTREEILAEANIKA